MLMDRSRSLDRERSSPLSHYFCILKKKYKHLSHSSRSCKTFDSFLAFAMHWRINCYSSSRLKGSLWTFCIAIYQVRVSTTWLLCAWQLLFTSYITWYDSLQPLSIINVNTINAHWHESELDTHKKTRIVWTRLKNKYQLSSVYI